MLPTEELMNTCPWCGVYVEDHLFPDGCKEDFRGIRWHNSCIRKSNMAIQKEPEGGFIEFHLEDPKAF